MKMVWSGKVGGIRLQDGSLTGFHNHIKPKKGQYQGDSGLGSLIH